MHVVDYRRPGHQRRNGDSPAKRAGLGRALARSRKSVAITAANGFTRWILVVRDALHVTYAKYPFIGYGTDWLAFAHIVIAIAFVGALRHPLRNAWLFQFGMIACVLVLPWALLFGELRGVPIYWRLIDCSFGVFGFVPNWLAHHAVRELEQMHVAALRVD